ncbi:thioesterase II family protein [Nitrospirillum iridis]|uniref:Medium-chain acyl-[acyl-carrier-protein] hydrolase n=1 Tax=Nitrospirillum iridis TaxID=765888 RepID=A0A7X0AV38_9PROT|nr:alpha/beta fold hydrolase [Nitrospirillum iridis]MBB6250625.1 medium-chain acyl-[acyl-carrier-protein] hydrolase [Nitrospirillum iridis]
MTPRWIADLNTAPRASVRLFFFPFAGGGSAAYRPWATALPPRVQASAVLLPGRESRLREVAHSRLEDLLDPLLAGLAPALDRPYAFFGHSMGATIAYEAARRLEAGGGGPGHLFVSGRQAPGRPRLAPPIHDLPPPLFIAALRRLNGTPAAILEDADLMAMLLPLLRADFALSETYRPQPGTRLRAPVTAFGGQSDPMVPADDVAAWEQVTDGAFTMALHEGDHFFLMPHRDAIVARILADLAPYGA